MTMLPKRKERTDEDDADAAAAAEFGLEMK